MIVHIDTDRLQDMMTQLERANDNIDDAASKLMSVTTHNSWACRERYTINEYVLENRSDAQKLKSDCARFTRTARVVSGQFIDKETGISRLFAGVEGALSRILANPVKNVVSGGIASSVMQSLASNLISNQNRRMTSGAASSALASALNTSFSHTTCGGSISSPLSQVSLGSIELGSKR